MIEEHGQLLWDVKTTAKSLGISPRTLWELTRRGEIPRMKVGRLVRYDPDDVRAWIKKQKKKQLTCLRDSK